MRIFEVRYDCWYDKKPGKGEDADDERSVSVVADDLNQAVKKANKHMQSEAKGVYGIVRVIDCTLAHEIKVI